MQPEIELQQDLVLVGGGHAHALALRMLAMDPIAGLRITLISPASHTPYSGMLPGLVAGHYSFEQTHIDLARLCQWAGVRFVAGEVTGLDPLKRSLELSGRPAMEYDLLSIDIGSQPELASIPGARAHAVPVKPVAGLWQRWREMYARLVTIADHEQHRVAVVGGGAGSVELALAMAHRLDGRPVAIDLWCGAGEILQNYNSGARNAVMAALERQGVELHLNSRVAAVEDASLVLEDGSRQLYDDLFWCTGASAAPWVAASGLRTDRAGFLAINDCLQSVDDERVFGAGDIASQVNHPRPKAGVYAVRQAPVLAHNLRASLLRRPMKKHRPQQRFLSLVSLGDRQAAADRGPFSASGAWVWRWKDRIDRSFMARFEELPAQMPQARDSLDDKQRQPHCGGCGAKVGAGGLGTVLASLAQDFPGYCNAGADDAAPLPVRGRGQMVQSLDMLREMVTDPWLMGRIAANHALSDLYACGARPVSALAAIILPFARGELLRRELAQVLQGALHEFAAADCVLAGGHSMQGPQFSLGFAVSGQAMDTAGKLLPKCGAGPGDRLVLTKPLGTGTLFAAHMQQLADGRDIATAVDSMLQANGAAAELALTHKATACTDITGFGLLGHLLEMLGQDMAAHLDLARLPLLPGVIQQLQAGVVSSMHAANAQALSQVRRGSGVDMQRLQAICDPQTSGGLLIAVPAQRATALVDDLHRRAYLQAVDIGVVTTLEPESRATPVYCT